jgi:hypothetical protein
MPQEAGQQALAGTRMLLLSCASCSSAVSAAIICRLRMGSSSGPLKNEGGRLMERLTPSKPLTFKFGIDHETKSLHVIAEGPDGAGADGTLTIDDLDRLMANLSQCQHALVISAAGGEQLMPPFNPTQMFEGRGGYVLAKRDAISRHTVGVDDTEGTVALLVLGSSGRLSGYRMSPERARQIANHLLTAADQTPNRPTQSFDA